MAWKQGEERERRWKFLCEWKAGGELGELLRAYGVSRASAYRWRKRYEREGLEGLGGGKRRPKRTRELKDRELWKRRIEKQHGKWRPGAKKLVGQLRQRYGASPSQATIGRLLREMGLSQRRRRRSLQPIEVLPSPLTQPSRVNEVWGVDFKGSFRTGDGQSCWVLTASDLYSRYVLACDVVARPAEKEVRQVMKRCFRRYGVPEVMRTDNGQPFGSGGQGAMGLSKLSVWWLQLGIRMEFMDYGAPYQNGRHERMHGSYLREALEPAAVNGRMQQKRNERWRRYFNRERAHEALGMETPQEHYQPAERAYREAEEFDYPKEWSMRTVKSKGEISWRGRRRYIGEAFSARRIALEAMSTDQLTWRVWFGEIEIGKLWEKDQGGMRPMIVKRKYRGRKRGKGARRPLRRGLGRSELAALRLRRMAAPSASSSDLPKPPLSHMF